jgi:hypothetical protein
MPPVNGAGTSVGVPDAQQPGPHHEPGLQPALGRMIPKADQIMEAVIKVGAPGARWLLGPPGAPFSGGAAFSPPTPQHAAADCWPGEQPPRHILQPHAGV